MCGSMPARASAMTIAASCGGAKYISGPRFGAGDPVGPAGAAMTSYGSSIAPVKAGPAITPSRNSFTLRTVIVGSTRNGPWS